jgi:hypothetical protein
MLNSQRICCAVRFAIQQACGSKVGLRRIFVCFGCAVLNRLHKWQQHMRAPESYRSRRDHAAIRNPRVAALICPMCIDDYTASAVQIPATEYAIINTHGALYFFFSIEIKKSCILE